MIHKIKNHKKEFQDEKKYKYCFIISCINDAIYRLWGGATDDDSSSNGGSSNKNSYINSSATTKEKHAKAQLGVLANATVKIYGLGNNTRKLLFTETTTSGSSIEAIGNFNAHENELLNDVYYLYEVSGGDDWDADDNGVVDKSSTKNKGNFRAIIKGSTVKSLVGKITISAISEILYAKVKNDIKTPELLDEKLMTASKSIIKDDLNNDNKIDSLDIVQYNPINHEDKLNTVYKDNLNEFIADIKNGYNHGIAVKPIIEGGVFNISKEISSSGNVVIGKVKIIDDGQSKLSFLLSGQGSSIFSIHSNGEIVISSSGHLNVQSYKLTVRAENSAGKSNVVYVTINVKNSSDTQAPEIIVDSYTEQPEIDAVYKTIIVNDTLSVTVEIEGEDKNVFNLYKDRDADNAYYLSSWFDFERPKDADRDNIYHVTIKATDAAGNVSKKPVTFKAINVLDERPILEKTYVEFTKREDIEAELQDKGEIFLGKIKVYSEGDSPISSIGLSTYNADTSRYNSIGNIVRVDNEGNAYLKSDTSYLENFNEEDGTRDKAIKFRNDFLKNLETEGAANTIRISAKNSVGTASDTINHNLNIITVTNDAYDIHPKVLSYKSFDHVSITSNTMIYNYNDGKNYNGYRNMFFDISNPNHIKWVDSNIKDRKVENMTLTSDGNIAFAKYKIENPHDPRDKKYAIKILDMQDLKSIKYLGRIMDDSSVSNYVLSKDNKYLYIIYRDSNEYTLKIYDVTNPSKPTFLISKKVDGYNIKLSNDGKKGFIASYNQLFILDLTDPKNPKSLHTFSKPEKGFDISPDGTKLYITTRGNEYYKTYSQLKVYDISNASSISEIGSFVLNKHIKYETDDDSLYEESIKNIKISPDGTKAYLCGDNDYGISIVDISDANSMSLLGYMSGFLTSGNSLNHIDISDDGKTLYLFEGRAFYANIFTIDVREDSEKED